MESNNEHIPEFRDDGYLPDGLFPAPLEEVSADLEVETVNDEGWRFVWRVGSNCRKQ